MSGLGYVNDARSVEKICHDLDLFFSLKYETLKFKHFICEGGIVWRRKMEGGGQFFWIKVSDFISCFWCFFNSRKQHGGQFSSISTWFTVYFTADPGPSYDPTL